MSRQGLRQRVEALFDSFARAVVRNRIATLLLCSAIAGAGFTWTPELTVDTSFEGMLRADHPVRLDYNAFRDQFGHDRVIIVALRPPDVFDLAFLATLERLHRDLEERTPYVREVTSLINARHTYGANDTLFVDELFETWPRNQDELEALRDIALQNPVYENHLISSDGAMAAIIVETEAYIERTAEDGLEHGTEILESDWAAPSSLPEPHYFGEKEIREVAEAVAGIVEPYRNEGLEIAVTGGPIVDSAFDRIARSDVTHLALMTMSIVVGFLALFFKRLTGIVMPITIIVCSIASTLGLMAIIGYPITVFTNILPTVLIATGTADSIHVLAIFYKALDTGMSREDAIAHALGHSGLTIVMTSLTTAGGFLSFAGAELAAVGEMGTVAAIGTIVTLLFTIIVLPMLISFIPMRPRRSAAAGSEDRLDRFLLGLVRLATRHPRRIVAFGSVAFAMGAIAASQVQFYNDMMDDLPDWVREKQELLAVDRGLRGTISVEAVLDTGTAAGISRPEFLKAVERASTRIEGIKNRWIYVGKTTSVVDVVKETNRALHDNAQAAYTIPNDRRLVAQELLLFEGSGSDDLERMVDSEMAKSRLSIKIPWAELFATHHFVEEVRQVLSEQLGDDVEVTMTGMAALMGGTFSAALHTMAASYGIAFVVITTLMCLLIGSWKLGLLSMFPNLLPILLGLGVMTVIGVPMNLAALLYASIALGVIVDDTMHFIYNFQKYFQETGDAAKAVEKTLLGTGRAIVITSCVLGISFMALSTATLQAAATFGWLTGFVIFLALVADLLVTPALVVLLSPSLARRAAHAGAGE